MKKLILLILILNLNAVGAREIKRSQLRTLMEILGEGSYTFTAVGGLIFEPLKKTDGPKVDRTKMEIPGHGKKDNK